MCIELRIIKHIHKFMYICYIVYLGIDPLCVTVLQLIVTMFDLFTYTRGIKFFF